MKLAEGALARPATSALQLFQPSWACCERQLACSRLQEAAAKLRCRQGSIGQAVLSRPPMAARGVCALQCGGTRSVPGAALKRAICAGAPQQGRPAPRARLALRLQRPLDRCLPGTRLRGCVAYCCVAALRPGRVPHTG